jgi:Flagellar protein FliT
MLNSTRQAQFELILGLTSAMLEKAQAHEWAAVMGLELERQGRLADFFATEVTPAEAAYVAAAIRQMQETNRRIMQQGEHMQQQIAGELRGLEAGRKATQAYNLNR